LIECSSTAILRHQFDDIDHLTERVQSFCKVRMTQLSAGCFQCQVAIIGFDEIKIVFTHSSCPILIDGEKPEDALVFACLLEVSGPCIIAHNRKVPHHTLSGLDPNLGISTVLPSNMRYVAVQIKRQVLQDCLRLMERDDLDDRFWATHNFLHLPDTFPTIQSYLQQLYQLTQHSSDFLHQSHLKTLLLEDFVPLLVNAIPPVTQDLLAPPCLITRAALVKQAEDYMLAHIDQPLTLQEICKALHVSERPLFYGFQEIYGISPMGYLKVQRLQSVRRLLKLADPATTNVTEIARKFGFWSGGHFSRDYRAMFGELPSETLRRAPLELPASHLN
jgi:AraC family transcriptional regulator, ethanolamine operon transcriptional activator